MDFETTETVRSTPSRHEKSLGLLTMKFVSLLQEAKDGVLDLKVAADSLAVKQKRRIYDITNVLEGVGLIEKKNKNIIQWRGENSGSQTQEVLEHVKVLKAQISELEAHEKELDNQKTWLEENIKHLNHHPITSTYKFVTHEDICNAFKGDTVLAVVAPAGTQLEVPLPETGQSGQKYQVNIRSHSAPIQVMLINRDSDSTIPVVFSVPPTDDICPIPTPPSTPASLQRFPLSTSVYSNTTSSYCSQDSVESDHQMVLPEHEVLTPSSTPPDVQMGAVEDTCTWHLALPCFRKPDRQTAFASTHLHPHRARVSQSVSSSVGAAADGPGRPRVPVCTGCEQPAEAQRCWIPHEGRPRGSC
ncbi:transcription factor E2F5 isoform X2 [Perca flavescens]|uniref:transcription factor E2F5 isoform X2 n=1 Tax=Perca flavescens TaxID=8167 RepID=UPI00106E89A1|nr:transcription factor E2F5-like isoform X2 [Perca flavescens]